MVGRGCKRCFGQLEKGSPNSLLHQPKPLLHGCNPRWRQCKPAARKIYPRHGFPTNGTLLCAQTCLHSHRDMTSRQEFLTELSCRLWGWTECKHVKFSREIFVLKLIECIVNIPSLNPILTVIYKMSMRMVGSEHCDPGRDLQECPGAGSGKCPKSAFGVLLGTWLGVLRGVFLVTFGGQDGHKALFRALFGALRARWPKALERIQKHSLRHFPALAPGHSCTCCLWEESLGNEN